MSHRQTGSPYLRFEESGFHDTSSQETRDDLPFVMTGFFCPASSLHPASQKVVPRFMDFQGVWLPNQKGEREGHPPAERRVDATGSISISM